MPYQDLPESPGFNPSGVTVGMIAAALVLILLVYILIWSPNFDTPVPGGDYLHFYLAARMVRDGEQDRLYDFPYQIQLQRDPARMPFPPLQDGYALYIYPPFFVWFCLPFSYLQFKAGAATWVLFMSGCLIAALRILLRTCGKTQSGLGLAVLAAFPFLPTLMSIYSCQNATLSLLIVSTTYALLKGGKPGAAGAVFALQAFKPQLTLVVAVAMLCKGQWRFVLGALTGGLVLLMASLAVSPAATGDYLRLGPKLLKWMDLPGISRADVACWRGFWRLLLGDQRVPYAQAAAAASSLITLLPLIRAFRGPMDTRANEFAAKFSALVLATIIVSPYLLYYDLTLLLIPMVLAACNRSVAGGWRAHHLLWPWLTAALYAAATLSRSTAAATGVQVVVPMILIYLVGVVETGNDRPVPVE
jgi:alpha-1,2-mannosyltransferase